MPTLTRTLTNSIPKGAAKGKDARKQTKALFSIIETRGSLSPREKRNQVSLKHKADKQIDLDHFESISTSSDDENSDMHAAQTRQ